MKRADSIWRSYDGIAQRYDHIWGSHFEEAARHMWTYQRSGFKKVSARLRPSQVISRMRSMSELF